MIGIGEQQRAWAELYLSREPLSAGSEAAIVHHHLERIKDELAFHEVPTVFSPLHGLQVDIQAYALAKRLVWPSSSNSTRGSKFHSKLEQVICLEAHAMVSLWEWVTESQAPVHVAGPLPWDRELHAALRQRDGIQSFDSHKALSPVLARWLEQLPPEVDHAELVRELDDEGLLKRFKRRIRVVRRKAALDKRHAKRA